MGLTLGLIGAGGSILTVPILVYMFEVRPVIATGYSLLVVGIVSLSGAISYWRHNLVNIRAVLIFAIPAMLTMLATRGYIIPAIPDQIIGITKDVFLMLLFSGLMIIAGMFMLKPLKFVPNQTSTLSTRRIFIIIIGSAVIGILTGMVGAGGGFLIIPTLIALFGLPVKEAIGTSLAIIAINSLIGFQGDISTGIQLDFQLIVTFISLTLLGMWLGTTFGKRTDGAKLKTLFALFTLLTGFAVFGSELHILLN
jgi:uncharacterized membrane protein YfcA